MQDRPGPGEDLRYGGSAMWFRATVTFRRPIKIGDGEPRELLDAMVRIDPGWLVVDLKRAADTVGGDKLLFIPSDLVETLVEE